VTVSPDAANWRQDDLVPRPDPTKLTTEAVDKATAQYRRELAALREIIETRLAGSDEDRRHLWDAVNGWPRTLEQLLEQRRREFLEDLASVRELVEQRLKDLDKAIKLAADEVAKAPGRTEAERVKLDAETTRRLAAEREFIVAKLDIVSSVMTEKFAAVDGQFSASKIAADAALTAQKEAVGEQNKANDRAIAKSETAVKEQLTSLGQVADASFKAMEDKITDARDRLTVIESLTRGIEQAGGRGRAEREEQRGERGMQNSTYVLVVMAVSAVVSVVAIIITLTLHK
jgi:hypothetical protein